MPWGKHFYVCHAERNATMNSSQKLDGFTLYSTLFPCIAWCKLIIQTGIKRVIYACDGKADKLSYQASKRMFDLAKIQYSPFQAESMQTIRIEFPDQVERIWKEKPKNICFLCRWSQQKYLGLVVSLIVFALGFLGCLAGRTLPIMNAV